jgi:hypothetical protein
VRRGAACRAVLRSCQSPRQQVASPRSCQGCRAPQTPQPERGLGRPAVVAVEDVRTSATPFVALSGSAVRRADVQPPGRVDVRCPGGRCPRDRCDPGVRTDRRPVSAAAAAKLSAARWIRNPSLRRGRPHRAQVRGGAVVGERLARRCPKWGLAGQGMVQRWPWVARRSVEGRAGPPLTLPPGMRTGSGAELAAWRPRELTRRQRAGGARKGAGAHQARPQVRRGRVVGVMATIGLDREVVTTLGGR